LPDPGGDGIEFGRFIQRDDRDAAPFLEFDTADAHECSCWLGATAPEFDEGEMSA